MKNIKKLILVLSLLMMTATGASAQGLGDLLSGLGKGGASSTVGNLIEGIFSKSDLTVADLTGEYTSSGPAIAFKSDNFLQNAGGIAGSAALETKLKPYYDQYGLNGMKLSVDKEGKFKLTLKGVPISGTITQAKEKGTFTFVIKAATLKLGQFTAYVEKSGKNINLMFDAKKLVDLLSAVGKVTGFKLATAMTSLLKSYDGAYIGFKMEYTGSGEADAKEAAPADSTANGTGSQLNGLFNMLKSSRNGK